MLGDRAEAEDVLQEAFLRLAQPGRAPDPDDARGPLRDPPDEVSGAWLRRVLLKLGVNRLRERRHAAERLERVQLDPTLDPLRNPSDAGSPTPQVPRAEARAEVQAVLATL